jgi:hypothetical protein
MAHPLVENLGRLFNVGYCWARRNPRASSGQKEPAGLPIAKRIQGSRVRELPNSSALA